MEREIRVQAGENLESMVYTLLAARARGEHVYCYFNGHMLHSDTVSMDSAYQEVMGCTKAEYDRVMNEWYEKMEKEEEERKARERKYMQKVEETRTEDSRKITSEKVIKGLKFIAEHKSLSQEELIEGLIELGCGFSLEDIKEQFPAKEVLLFEGMKKGDMSCGASVIANMRDSEFGRDYGDDRFLSVDDDTSIYHFIRITTGDESYTKENIDELNAENRRHR